MNTRRNKKYTADEFFSLVPDSVNDRAELINGEITPLAAPDIVHQTIVMRAASLLDRFAVSHGGNCRVIIAPFDVMLNDENIVQPDISVVCAPSRLDGRRCTGAPDLIIEVTSSNYARDYVDKLVLYKNAGVREYWIVDPAYERIMVYFFERSSFPQVFSFDSPVPVNICGGEMSINIAELL